MHYNQCYNTLRYARRSWPEIVCGLAVIAAAKKAGAVSIPGALTPTEVVAARQAGADVVKLFPAGDFGVGYIKSLRAPLAHNRPRRSAALPSKV